MTSPTTSRRLLGLLALTCMTGCEVLVPQERPLAVFEGIPAWFEKEFQRGGDGLSSTFARLERTTEKDAERLGESLGGAGALVDREIDRGSAGLAWQGRVLDGEFTQTTEATEQNVLGAPGWIGREVERGVSDLEAFGAERWYRIRRDADLTGRHVTRFLTFLFR